MTTRYVLLCLTLLYTVALHAQGIKDVIVMKNGDRLTGEITGLSAGVLSVKVPYIDGRIAVQWSQVASLESARLYLIHTESGAVYTGKLSTSGETDDPPIRIEIATAPPREVEIQQHKVVSLGPTSESFWQRFNGAVNTGILYSKGNDSVQYDLSSQVSYDRERWSTRGAFNSTFASNTGSSLSTRNQVDLTVLRLLRWNKWFYAGNTSFLQSSVQEINLQTTLSGGVGRYLVNSNRASIYLLGGFGWQNAGYKQYSVDQSSQNTVVGFGGTEIKAFKFKKTNLDITASILPAISGPGRVHFNTNATYNFRITGDLSWNVSFYGSWDTRPPATFPKSDYGTSSGLSWTFGNQ